LKYPSERCDASRPEVANAAPNQLATFPRNPHPDDAQGKILIVEDEPELAELLERFLRRHGFITAVSGDGLNACRLINSLRPDLILLDVMLPELDGWEICRLVRKIPDPSLAQTPIIMLSALDAAENRAQGLKLGANDYIAKPYSLKQVLQRSTKLIEEHKEHSIR
jgi:DNA-binding response OmpR family regulator